MVTNLEKKNNMVTKESMKQMTEWNKSVTLDD